MTYGLGIRNGSVNLTRQGFVVHYSLEDQLSEDQRKYLETKIKPKEIVIIIFMMLLWLFSIRRFVKKNKNKIETIHLQ